jgi:hypothetical protein
MLLKAVGKAPILPDMSKMLQGYVILSQRFTLSDDIISKFIDYHSALAKVPDTNRARMWKYLESDLRIDYDDELLSNLSGDLYYAKEEAYGDITNSCLTILCGNDTNMWVHQVID